MMHNKINEVNTEMQNTAQIVVKNLCDKNIYLRLQYVMIIPFVTQGKAPFFFLVLFIFFFLL